MNSARRLALLLTASPIAILAASANALAAPAPAHVSLQGLTSDTQQAGQFSAWLPVMQAPGAVMWASPYFVGATGYTAAGFGLGYRALVSPTWALGAYAFIDGSAATDESWLWQGTLGIEALSNGLEARANVYVPLAGNSVTAGYDVQDAVLNSDNMLEIIRGHRIGATAVDGEVGARILNWGDPGSRDGLRAFAGAYASWQEDGTTTGFSGRLEARFTDRSGTSLTFGGGLTYGSDGTTQWAAMIGLSTPLGPTGGSGGGGSDGANLPPMDADPVHHLGAISTIRQQADAAYFLNGRPTGLVEYADGVANTSNDGLTVATATSLSDAVTDTGENGIIVAVGGNGDLVTTGQTLQDGQAIVGSGAYLNLAAADGTTGFRWQADGPSAGTLSRTGSGFTLTLADYNTIVGIGVKSLLTSTSFDSVVLGGINGQSTTGAYISGNTINVTAQGAGNAGTAADESANPEASATGGQGSDGIANSAIYGIDLEGARDADVSANLVTLTVQGAGGTGGAATAGSGATGGNATGGKGGRGISLTDIVGISAESTQDTHLAGNSVGFNVQGAGGSGGAATGGNGTGGAAGTAGTGTGGAGGSGIEGSDIWGIYGDGARDLSVVGNDGTLTVQTAGGGGNTGTGGNSDTTSTVEVAGGTGNGGAGGDAIHGTTFGGISVANNTGDLDVVGNDLTLTTSATGGDGGNGNGGDGANTVQTSHGGAGNGGAGGDAADTFVTYGFIANSSHNVSFIGNETTHNLTLEGGDGGTGPGGAGGDSSAGSGGSGGASDGGDGGGGLVSSTVVGVSVYQATGTLQLLDQVSLSIISAGGDGANATSGNGGDGATFGGVTDGAFGGNGGDGIRLTTITGIDAGSTSGSIDADLTLSVDGHGGDGGIGNGGNAGAGTVQAGTASEANFGGSGGDGMETVTFRGINLNSATDAIVIASTLTLDVTANAGVGGESAGGNGANGPTQTNTAAAHGGDGSGGDGGAGITGGSYVALDASQSTGSQTFAVHTTFTVDANGALGGIGFGGNGGNATDARGGNAGDGTGGDGGAGSTGATYALLDAGQSSGFTSFADVASLTIGTTAGNGGGGTGGDGGSGTDDGGTGGKSTGGAGGGINVTATALNLAGASNSEVTASVYGVTLNATAGVGSDASGGSGGSPDGLGGGAYGGAGGDVAATLTGLDLRNAGGTAMIKDSTFTVTLDATAGDAGGGFAGSGGLSGGTDGHGEGALGGSVAPVVFGVTIANAANVTMLSNDTTVTFDGAGGDSGDASGNSTSVYLLGGTGDTTPSGINLLDMTGVGSANLQNNDFTQAGGGGTNGAGGQSLP